MFGSHATNEEWLFLRAANKQLHICGTIICCQRPRISHAGLWSCRRWPPSFWERKSLSCSSPIHLKESWQSAPVLIQLLRRKSQWRSRLAKFAKTIEKWRAPKKTCSWALFGFHPCLMRSMTSSQAIVAQTSHKLFQGWASVKHAGSDKSGSCILNIFRGAGTKDHLTLRNESTEALTRLTVHTCLDYYTKFMQRFLSDAQKSWTQALFRTSGAISLQ